MCVHGMRLARYPSPTHDKDKLKVCILQCQAKKMEYVSPKLSVSMYGYGGCGLIGAWHV